MPVPHNPPLGRNEGPANYVAGCNRPGYLPVSEPEFFEAFDDAKRYACNLIEEHADDAAEFDADDWNSDTADELSAMAENVNLESSPFCTPVIGDVVFWVEEVEQAK